MARLGDVATYINGYAFKLNDWGRAGLPIIRIQDLTGNSYQTNRYAGEYNKKYEVNPGDVLISWSASLGVYIWNNEKALLNQHIFKVIFDKVPINKSFFVYQVKRILDRASDAVHGATMKHLTKPVFDALPFYLPSMDEQIHIASILDTAAGLIDLYRQELVKLDELVKARFMETFVSHQKDICFQEPALLGSICQVNPKKNKDHTLDEDTLVSFVPMTAVTDTGGMDAAECKPYGEVKTGYTYFEENDVLFAKITPCMENGKGAIAKGLCNGVGFGSTEFHILRPIAGKSNPVWLYVLTSLEQFRQDAAAHMTGSAGQRRVPASFLEQYRISVPPIDLQNQFAAFAAQAEKSKTAVQSALDKAQLLFDSLMQEYFG